MYFIFGVHPAKPLMRKKKHILLKKIYKHMVWFNIFYIYKKIKKHIFASTFEFNNQFIESMRTWSIFK